MTFTQNKNFYSTPANLTTLASYKYFNKNNYYNNCCDKFNKWLFGVTSQEKECIYNVFSCNLFEFILVDSTEIVIFDDVMCSELENTLGALILSEFQSIYFKLLNKLIENQEYRCKIPISLHFYHQLYFSGVIHKFLLTKNFHDMQNLLLMLSGDVESNPGPSYKEQCQQQFFRNKQAKKIYKTKEEIRAENYVKNIEEMEHKNVSMQMFGVSGLVSAIPALSACYLGNKTRKTMDTAHSVLNKLNNNIDTISELIMNNLKNSEQIFKTFNQKLNTTIDYLSFMRDIIFSIVHLCVAHTNTRIRVLCVEITRILTTYMPKLDVNQVISYFMQTPQFLNDKKQDQMLTPQKKQVQMQINLNGIEKYLSPTNLMLFVYAMLTLMFTSMLPTKTSTENLLKRIGEIGRSAKGIKELNDVMTPMFSQTLQQLGIDLNIFSTDDVISLTQDAEKWFRDVQALLEREDVQKKSDALFNDIQVILYIEELYKQGLEISRQISDKRIPYAKTMGFQMHFKYLSDLMRLVDTSGAFGTRPRTQPVVIWLYGESGVGKSGMSWPLAVDLNNCIVQNVEEAKNFSKHIYMRNVEQEFWDNYHGQNVVVYDDFGQLKDSQSNPNTEFIEIIRTANIAPYPLHMAHLEDKRKTRFTSKVVLLTSNIFEHSISSLTFPDAFKRRIDLCGRVKNKDEYTKAGYSAAQGQCVQRLDKEKVQKTTGNIISTDVYLIDVIEPESGTVIQEDVEYEQFLKMAIEQTKTTLDSSRRMNEFLVNYAQENFEKRKVQIQALDNVHWRSLTSEEITNVIMNIFEGKDPEIDIYNFEGERVDAITLGEMYYTQIDTDEMSLGDQKTYENFIYENFRVKTNAIVAKLRVMANKTLLSISEWASKTIEYVKDHPYHTVCGVILGVVSIFGLASLWNNIFSQQIDMCKIKNSPNVTLSDDENMSVDLTDMPYNQVLNEVRENKYNKIKIRQPTVSQIKNISKVSTQPIEVCSQESVLIKASQVEGCSSGDARTLVVKPKMLEGCSSGDVRTLINKTKVVEANVSADMKTNCIKSKVLEANVSSDLKTIVSKAKILEGEHRESDLQMWRDEGAQTLIASKIYSNLYKIIDSLGNPLMNCLFVKGHTILCPGHIQQFLEQDEILTLRNVFGVEHKFKWDKMKVYPIETREGAKEAIMFTVPNHINAHADITKHFSDSISMSQYKRAKTCLPTIRWNKVVDKYLMYILGNTECKTLDRPLILDDAKLGEYMLRQGLEYELNTIAGDCGAPLIINENAVLRKIAGIHVAGSKNGDAYAESITQLDLQRTMLKIPVQMQIGVDVTHVISNVKIAMNVETDVREIYNYPEGEFNYIAECQDKMLSPSTTALRRSLLYGKLYDVKTRPSALYNKNVNIKHRNLAKCAGNVTYIDEELINDSYYYVRQKWLNNKREDLAFILTYEEAISGRTDLSEFLGPIHRQSSPGYPWIKNRKSNKPGKTGWFGDGEIYQYNEEVRESVKYRIDKARVGERVTTLWTDTLKDERRPHEKVDALKTRVFSNGPMDFNIAFRMYYLGFVAHLMENRISNEVSIGTNVYSRDWTKTANKLSLKGRKVIAGDFSGFDGSLHPKMMLKFVDLANEFYNDGEENALIRLVLMLDIVNSIHICDQAVYMMTHSQPSGNPITTPLNCLINSLGIRMCFSYLSNLYRVPYTLQDFNKHVSMVSYGDDNVINFSDEIAEWFNMETITTAFEIFGFKYTDEMKGANGVVPKWRELKDISYLKRKFRLRHELPIYDAPLDLDTIKEMPNWCRETVDIFEGTKVNAEVAVMELHMHDEDVFNEVGSKIQQQFLKTTGENLECGPYNIYFKERLIKYFM